MKKLLYYLAVGATLAFSNVACSERSLDSSQVGTGGSKAEKKLSVNFEMKSIKEQKEDSNSPIGYWEKDIEYPVLSGASYLVSVNKINQSIELLVNKYTCKNGGDKTFSSSVEYISDNIFVLSYESMWMCGEMPHPDSDSGIKIYAVKTGVETTIENYRSPALEMEVKQLILSEVKKENLVDVEDCPSLPSYNYVYPEKDGVAFSFVSGEHEAYGCDYKVLLDVEQAGKYLSGLDGL